MEPTTPLSSACDPARILPGPATPGTPITALAPMQDVTTLPFMTLVGDFGAPDYFFTEYFRVYEHSRLDPHILRSVTENPTGRPVFAQLIGENLTDLARIANDLLQYPQVAGVDLNMGCPAPKVYRKNVGGGLLREVAKIDEVLGCLRAAVPGLFTVKMRIGFDGDDNFEAILDLINAHKIDLLSLHARTVKEMYRSEVHYEYIARAAERVNCPVLANGNISSVEKAVWTLENTRASGLMIGRSAIRNPWIFRQIREHFSGLPVFQPTLADAFAYVEKLRDSSYVPDLSDLKHSARMKKFLNFVGQSVDPEGLFLHEMRRAKSPDAILQIADKFMLADGKAEQPFSPEPYPGLIARPNRESPSGLAPNTDGSEPEACNLDNALG